MRADRRALALRAAPAILVAVLAVAWLVPTLPGLRSMGGDASAGVEEAVEAWEAALDELPDAPLVLVAFDPDLGTYAEIRPSVRTALAELLYRDARLAVVSLTPEGRALALAELGRLDDGGSNPTRRLDLGYVPGAEAAIVEIAREVRPPADATGEIARRLRDDGTRALDAVLVVGGNELGPRSWVEQLLPRTEGISLLAVAPTVLLPELLPYRASGQLDALLGTPIEGAAYRDRVELGRLARFTDATPPRTLPVAIGLVVALGVLGQALARRAARPGPRGDREGGMVS